MEDTKTQILTKSQVLKKIKRMAYEIYEHNFKEEEVVFAGIDEGGYTFAELLQKEFSGISPIKSKLIKVTLDKTSPLQSEIKLDVPVEQLKNKVIIITDDVQNTGRTLAYSIKPFLNIRIKKLQTAVIVDRGHKSFPISADYVGYAMSTTIKEHIKVILSGKDFGVYLK